MRTTLLLIALSLVAGCSRADAGADRGAACDAETKCADESQCLNGLCRDAGMLIRETKALTDALCTCDAMPCTIPPLEGLKRIDADYEGIALNDAAKDQIQSLLNRGGRCLKALSDPGPTGSPRPAAP